MRHSPVKSAAAIAIAVGALVAGTATAGADGGAKSKIVLKSLSPSGASGAVKSGRGSCRPNRKVSLFIYEGFVTDKIAITYTNSNGAWRVDRNLNPGRYFAKVDSSGGCRYDNSKAKRLG
jgi:hypothetical protein